MFCDCVEGERMWWPCCTNVPGTVYNLADSDSNRNLDEDIDCHYYSDGVVQFDFCDPY